MDLSPLVTVDWVKDILNNLKVYIFESALIQSMPKRYPERLQSRLAR
jgi:hypothetical protein